MKAHDRRHLRANDAFVAMLAVACLACCRTAAAQAPPANNPAVAGAQVPADDIAALARAVREQLRLMEQLRSQNETLARNNQELLKRVQALETRSAAAVPAGADAAVTRAAQAPAAAIAEAAPSRPPSATNPMPATDSLTDVIVEAVPGQPVLPPEFGVSNVEPLATEAGPPFLPFANSATTAADTVTIAPLPNSDLGPAPSATKTSVEDFFFGRYDNGFILVEPRDPKKTPFAAKLNVVTQERYTGFARKNEFWQPWNVQTPIRVNNRSTFDVNRGYIGFSGFAIDPRLRYSMIVATTSVVNVTFLLGTVGFQFDKAFGLYGGFNKVPGSREWLESFKHTLGADRSMATTFFRPSMSPGVWISGEPLEYFHYYAMISNSINSLDQFGDRRSTQMCYSGSIWWEPLGAFGPGFADEEFHENAVIRLGGSGLFSRQLKEPGLGDLVQANPENTILRLSNGIPVFIPGALEPGVSLLATDDRLLALDAGLKYRGFSLSGEYYFRLLNNFSTDKPLSQLTSVYDQGGYLQTGFALIPKKLEAYAKTSLVAGPFGSGNDYGGGLNWYVSGNRNWRITGEVLQVNRSPASNILTPYRIGQSGTIGLLQLVTDF